MHGSSIYIFMPVYIYNSSIVILAKVYVCIHIYMLIVRIPKLLEIGIHNYY